MPDVVVVGVDGSENAWNALAWAKGEAILRGGSLRIVCSFEDPVATVGIGTAFGTGGPITVDPELIEDAAKAVVEEARRRVGGDVEAELVARCDRPAAVLCELSRDAALLVVGSRGHSAVGSLLLGSVSNYVAHHSSCPVVIVPHEA
jgi:nucleotide-binding universal stress UspA family protein